MGQHGESELLKIFLSDICADPESYVRGGPNLIMFFFS